MKSGAHIDNRKKWFSEEDVDTLRAHGFRITGSVNRGTVTNWKWLFIDTEVYLIWNAGDKLELEGKISSHEGLKEFLRSLRGKELAKKLKI